MAGYALEIKRNDECAHSPDLKKLVFLGHVATTNIHDNESGDHIKEHAPRGTLESLAATVPPPPRGQNIRAPIDGVSTDCREELGYVAND